MTQQNQDKDIFLKKALTNIPFDGLGISMLEGTSEQIGKDKNHWKTLFPKGVKDLFSYYQETVNTRLLEVVKKEDLDKLKVRERIFTLVQSYIQIIAPHKEIIRASLAFYALPQNILLAPKSIWEISDIMWIEAGDTSTDYNRYTKRTLLSGVLSSTILFWLNDTSDENEKTWAFLERRISNVLTVGKKIQDIKSFISTKNPFDIFKKRNGKNEQ